MRRRAGNIEWKKSLSPRVFAAVLLGCLTAVLAFSQAAASVGLPIETFRPLGAGFFSTRSVQAEASRQIVGQGPPADPVEVAALGRLGLIHAPLNTRALWLVGQSFDARGQTQSARAAMRQAERVSRRNAAVQLWLGSDSLKNREVEQGLRNFDLLIRTNSEAAEFVTPELAKLIAHPEGRQQLAPYFTERNPWLINLMWAAASKLPSGEPLATLLSEQKRAAPDVEGIRPVYAYLLKRLITEESYQLAMKLHPKLPGMNLASLRSFDPVGAGNLTEGYPPFTWDFAEGGTRGGDVVSVGEGRAGLEIYGMPGTVGTAASKLISPGERSTFHWRVVERSSNAQSAVKWVATCLIGPTAGAKKQSDNLLDDSHPLHRRMTMSVPSSCDLMRFDLEVVGGIGRYPASAIVADAALADIPRER